MTVHRLFRNLRENPSRAPSRCDSADATCLLQITVTDEEWMEVTISRVRRNFRKRVIDVIIRKSLMGTTAAPERPSPRSVHPTRRIVQGHGAVQARRRRVEGCRRRVSVDPVFSMTPRTQWHRGSRANIPQMLRAARRRTGRKLYLSNASAGIIWSICDGRGCQTKPFWKRGTISHPPARRR